MKKIIIYLVSVVATKTIVANLQNRTVEGMLNLTIHKPTSGGYMGHLGSGSAKWKAETDGALVKAHRSGAGRGRALDTNWRAEKMTEDFVVVNTEGKEIVSGKAGDYLVVSETGKYNYGVKGGTPKPGWYNSGLKFEVVKRGSETFSELDAATKKVLRK